MRTVLPFLLIFLIFSGCDGTYDNGSTESEQAFSVSMAPAFAPGAATEPIPVNAQLLLHASTALDPATVHENSIYIQNSSAQRQPATITLVAQDIIIQPKVYLTPNTTFDIIITTEVTTTNGAHLTRNAVVSFISGVATGDIDPPLFLGANIKTGGTTHPDSTLYFQFDEPLSPLSVSNSMITMSHPEVPNETITGTVGVIGSLLYFKPSTPIKTFEQLQSDVGYDINLSLAGNISDLSGNTYTSGFLTFDTLGTSNTVPLTQVPLINTNSYNAGNTIYALERQNSTLFSGGVNGLHIVNYTASNSTFTPLARLNTTTMGTVYSITVDSIAQRLYLGTSTGVAIVDISDLTSPSLLSVYPTSASVFDTDVHNDHLYVAASIDGVIDLNISDSTAPKFIQQNNTDGIAFDVMFSPDTGYGNFIHIADYNNGMNLLDDAFMYPTSGSFTGFFGQIRSVLHDQNNSNRFIALSSVGGFYTYDLQSTPPPGMIKQSSFPSYATKAVSNTDSTAFINLKDMGIGLLDYGLAVAGATFTKFYAVPFQIKTFTKVSDNSYEHLILVDSNGKFYAINTK